MHVNKNPNTFCCSLRALQSCPPTPCSTTSAVCSQGLRRAHALPAIYPVQEIVGAGGLISYAASPDDAWRIVGSYVGCILGGEKAADLPVCS
jgi:ABC-type uncharacterized transport system substrate-binding protein